MIRKRQFVSAIMPVDNFYVVAYRHKTPQKDARQMLHRCYTLLPITMPRLMKMSEWDDIAAKLDAEYAEQNRFKTAEKDYTHAGIKWHLTLTKDTKTGTYKALAAIDFGTHSETLDLTDGTHFAVSGGVKMLRKGEALDANPVAWLVPYVAGFIDNRLQAMAIMDMVADDPETKTNALGDEAAAGLHNLLTAMQDYNMQPRTNATPEQKRAMREQAEKLIDTFGPVGLASIIHKHQMPMMGESLKKTAALIRGWRSRGRIPAKAANHLCKLRVINTKGFTREVLRPDVGYWYIDDAAKINATQ